MGWSRLIERDIPSFRVGGCHLTEKASGKAAAPPKPRQSSPPRPRRNPHERLGSAEGIKASRANCTHAGLWPGPVPQGSAIP